ncbi:MAG TPA: sugar phosphate isomerase/epimerase family protein [Methylomirabilota bacterium]|nr:sugar phosphate isomerase/epimerase family protein [Methylomirabilota bacterium]
MIRFAVTVSLVPEARGGPFVFQEDLAEASRKAVALGFHAVEIFPRSADELDPARITELLARHNLKVAAVGTGAGWLARKWHLCHAEGEIRAQAKAFIKEIVDLAGRLDAPAIIGSMQGRSEGSVTREQAMEWLAEGLNELGEHAARYERPLLYEPLNRYETNLLNRSRDAVDFVSSLNTKNVRLLADLFHMNIEEASLEDGILQYGGLLGHVHFVDSNRRAPGMGHIDFGPVVGALRKVGYGGFVSAEALPLPDPMAAARQIVETYARLFG